MTVPVRGYIAVVFGLLVVSTPLAGLQPGPRFEVASIKLIPPNTQEGPVAIPGSGPGNYYRTTSSVRALLQTAYQMPFVRQIGAPEWTRTEIYSVNAKIPDDVESTPENQRAMIRAMLQERFKLVAREEERELQVYSLTLARADKRLGPKLHPSNCPPRVAGQPSQKAPNPLGVVWEVGPNCGQIQSGRGMILLGNQPMSRLVETLQYELGRVVLDHTGLEGNFVLEVIYQAQQLAVPADGEKPSLTTALIEQLGLKVESTRAPARVLVIDSIEKPTEN